MQINDIRFLIALPHLKRLELIAMPQVKNVAVLRDMVEKIASSGLGSPLAVLKRLGPGRAGFMSFPMEGWTLAVDFSNRSAAEKLIAKLEDMTAGAGGRIYLAKDALARPDVVAAMYPERADWLAEVQKIDPEGNFETDLTRRLQLRAAP